MTLRPEGSPHLIYIWKMLLQHWYVQGNFKESYFQFSLQEVLFGQKKKFNWDSFCQHPQPQKLSSLSYLCKAAAHFGEVQSKKFFDSDSGSILHQAPHRHGEQIIVASAFSKTIKKSDHPNCAASCDNLTELSRSPTVNHLFFLFSDPQLDRLTLVTLQRF